MAHYVDGFVIPLPKKNLENYRRGAQKAGKIWRDHGALEFRECAGDDLNIKWESRFRAESKPSPARRYCSPILCSSPAHIATASTRRS
jgi:uncharacterized protein YbaA (DUF1428 family)